MCYICQKKKKNRVFVLFTNFVFVLSVFIHSSSFIPATLICLHPDFFICLLLSLSFTTCPVVYFHLDLNLDFSYWCLFWASSFLLCVRFKGGNLSSASVTPAPESLRQRKSKYSLPRHTTDVSPACVFVGVFTVYTVRVLFASCSPPVNLQPQFQKSCDAA